jgi:hypothetical protein
MLELSIFISNMNVNNNMQSLLRISYFQNLTQRKISLFLIEKVSYLGNAESIIFIKIIGYLSNHMFFFIKI